MAFSPIVLLWSLISLASASVLYPRSQCTATLDTATVVATRLNDYYFDNSTGFWGILWTDANTLEDLHNLMLADGSNDFVYYENASYIGGLANEQSESAWSSAINGANDDAGWIVLSLWKMADYKSARGEDYSAYINSASMIYDMIAGQWDDTCGGGVWWSTAHTYKNAITNELFLYISASGYLRFQNDTYLENAEKVLSNSGMRNSEGLYNDGLTLECVNNGETTWIYNQGVIASGLGALSVATGNTTLLTEAEITLDATVSLLTDDGVLRESCDDAEAGGSSCDHDQTQGFQGIWMKHVQYYLDNASDRASKYSDFLGVQNNAVTVNATDSDEDIGSVWYAANEGGSIFQAETSTSGLAAHISAAKYGPC
ncbi:Six-hairpin glycosidase [Fistulina hepatica ATCC 64428]|uniref:Six-hairpin glycosidase n=1 Tax=Fistulina hepatica ATCC 64428 TaxID=1128425 RepID=A0A0D7AML9_9AGAR|nr:Six-hairpin glycosidase [Fistulina hepatica ATCC 64428]